MRTPYNRVAGQSLERLAALSDGIFAVAMTLLVLDLRVVAPEMSHVVQPIWSSGALPAEAMLWSALLNLAPRLLTYFMSFLTLGMFWVGQQTQFNHFSHSDRNLTWIHIAFLCCISLMPFSTGFLAEYITFRVALLVYWFNLLVLGAVLLAGWRYAERAGLLHADTTHETSTAIVRRIAIVQVLYAVCVALSAINTYVSIGLIVLLQLNSAIAPRIRFLDRF